MKLKFKNRNGDIIAEVDSDTLDTRQITANLTACSICKRMPTIGRDRGHWYIAGNDGCAACSGLYALPDEEELKDRQN